MRVINVFLACLCFILTGCGGGSGGTFTVGSIEGPLIIAENMTVEYSIPADGVNGISYTWSIDPPTAGTIQNPTSSTIQFKAVILDSHMTAKITVVVSAGNRDPEIRSLNIEIRDLGDLEAANIEGPDILDENAIARFSVLVSADIIPSYEWTCEPTGSGTFISPNESETMFRASFFGEDTDIELSATINAASLEPVTISKTVAIRDIYSLSVGQIEGITMIEENKAAVFSVDASGDSEISYIWTCYPASVGTFLKQNSPSVGFLAADVEDIQNVLIKVKVGSKNSPAVSREFETNIRSVPDYDWGTTWNSSTLDLSSIATDNSGNVYVAGYYWGALTFESDPVNVSVVADENTAYLAKIDSGGDKVWLIGWEGLYGIEADDVEIDDAGNIYVGGIYDHIVDFDPGPDHNYFMSDGYSADCYVSKFDTSGNYYWTRVWGGEGNEYLADIAVDGDGNIASCGTFAQTVDFDPGPGEDIHEGDNYSQSYVMTLDPNGNYRWTQTFGSSSTEYIRCVAADHRGNIFAGGEFRGDLTIESDPSIIVSSSDGSYDAYMAGFGPNGGCKWLYRLGNEYNEEIRAIKTHKSGLLAATGNFYYTMDFDPTEDEDFHSTNVNATFVSVYDLDGRYKWTQITDGGSYGTDIAFDPSGRVYCAGETEWAADFNPDPDVEDYCVPEFEVLRFFNCYSPSGDYRYTRAFDYGGSYTNPQLAINPSGKVFFADKFSYVADLNPGRSEDERDIRYDKQGGDCFITSLSPD